MELFDRNQYLTPKEKTFDRENIDYSKVHIEIYQGTKLGKDWRVDTSKQTNEIQTAVNGLTDVTYGLENYPSKGLFFQQVLHKIKSIFSKK
ncbi:MAG: hypothetical protein AAF518_26695 [Spirochaetota bacterium]